ncbi:uncharacterized protein LOC123559455 isoform X2 [Mercenaria mercenaria]|uniref:uncharacterized protein LOC123559455 isoform X2 n=1 Tax=Mercenaria mercenaria TaxID=6596 RepID=UPI00234E4332|nr:uncharacterized protein LOC123559455 isoform X2 [Mercenaria mercenaria]
MKIYGWDIIRQCEYLNILDNLFSSESRFVTINGDPGHCFPGCGESTVIGVTKSRCYCLGDAFSITKDTETGCTDKCNHPTVACGQDYSPTKYSYLSIYKINPNVTASSISKKPPSPRETNCLKIDPSDQKTLYWDRCQSYLQAMCFNKGRVENMQCASGSDFCTWVDAANTCFSNGYFPTLYSNSFDVKKDDGSPIWTGLFKSNVVYQHNSNFPEDRRHDQKQFGFLKKESETNVKLMFTTNDSMKRILCMKDRKKKNTLTTHVPKTESSSVNITEFSSFPTTTLSDKSETAEGSSGIYIAIGVCVSVASIVLLIVFLRRRRKETNQGFLNPHNNTAKQTIENDNDCPELAMPTTSQSRHVYFILEPREKEPENINETYNTASEDTAYDRTDIRQDHVKTKSENVYNQLDTAKDTTYDQAYSRGGRKAVSSDCTFAHKQVCSDGQSSSIYNTSNIDDGEYHHIGSNLKQSKTDNIYGIHGTEGGDKSLVDDHSTYNCISIDCTETVNTNNPYSSLGAK